MIDHVTLDVSDYEASKRFYVAAFAPLGYAPLFEFEEEGVRMLGLGRDGKPDFWIAGPAEAKVAFNVHVALRAVSRAAVDAFHAAALAGGGRCNGAPGLRPHYHPDYYGAFVFCPDGYNIEAVCHAPA